MKYRNIALGLILLVVLTFTGCACEHEWIAADCLNHQTCAKCNEVGEPALGHDWLNATCTAPRTCSRCAATEGAPLDHDWVAATCTAPETCACCSATQGESLAHTYGDWTFGEDEMTHTCLVCAFEETTELDQEIYLETLLTGHWDYFGDFTSGALESASSSNIIGLYLSFGDGRRATLKQATTEAETGTWELTYFREVEGVSAYYIDILLESVTMTVVLYHEPASPENDLIVVHQSTFTPVFSKNTKGVALIAGNWGIAPNKWGYYTDDHSYWFSFRDDRTVTCNINGTFEGIWHLVPITYSGYVLGYGVAIEYNNGGETEYIQGTLRPEELLVPDSPFEFSLKYHGNELPLGKVDDAEFETIRNRTNPLLGKWTSSLISESFSDGAGTATTDYSITFHREGTFTADFDQEYTGKWYVDQIPAQENDGYFLCMYYLYFDGQRQEAYCFLESEHDEIKLTIGNYPGSNNKDLQFTQLSDEEAEVLTSGSALPVGAWTSYYYSVENADGSNEDVFTEDYSINFYKDGTFTALLDKEMTGTWTYHTHEELTDTFDGVEQVYYFWEYYITFQGESTQRHMYITQWIDDTQMLQIYAPHPETEDQEILYGMTRSR